MKSPTARFRLQYLAGFGFNYYSQGEIRNDDGRERRAVTNRPAPQ